MLKIKTLAAAIAVSLPLVGSVQAENTFAKPPTFWWPDRIDLTPLRQHNPDSNPYGADFNYAAEFAEVDMEALKADVRATLTDSQDWWPADYGHYGPFFIRMAWHSAGTYRVADGRGGAGGGQQRFEPLNSWPDNGNLDKARRLMWPVKQKYGRQVSWADLMILAGTVAMEDMGFKSFGFAGGRADDWEPDLVYWGPETVMLADERYSGKRDLKNPLAAVQMGLIYVNPEGPNGNPDPALAAHDIRETFGRMAMNDAETVALIAGGHSFGKAHGAHKPAGCLSVEPGGAGVEEQSFGWKNSCGKGHSEDTITSGFEGAWTATPTQWSMMYLANLFAYDWEVTKSPAGAVQWIPTDGNGAETVPDAHIAGKSHAPIMFTTDLSLKVDPAYREISQRFLANPAEFEDAFARAWFKLTHRDMGPRARYVGADVPSEVLLWQDPIPEINHPLISTADTAALKSAILASDLSVPQLVRTAWASAASYRDSDMRGGANGARIRLAPMKDWPVNNPEELSMVLAELTKVQEAFNSRQSDGKQVSMADMIVLGGSAAIEKAAADAGFSVTVPFNPGRMDASQEFTDVASFSHLQSTADGFRNYYDPSSNYLSPINAMIDKSNQLDLTPAQMTALVGGLRVLGGSSENGDSGVLTERKGVLTTDFFVNLLDMGTVWQPSGDFEGQYVGTDRRTGARKWTATPVDLMFGSSAELRAISEVYAANDGSEKFINDFVASWVEVMNNDRFDLEVVNGPDESFVAR
ncbi:catalase/peroxidase HPI [Luminiphilus sp. nBUS_16]|uniref:catalase/peroxidase HPI n=1 Tax=Luminiphilus sp. nBUS_16 TaxID=3395315 RepID=UPI003EB88537